MDLPLSSAIAARLDFVKATGSTNADLRAHASDASGWPDLSVLVTDDQTAGRGRLDRAWVAPAGTSLAISVLLRALPDSPEARGWIPLVAGVAMADAVSAQLPGRDIGVKWPNDVLIEGRKISGILAEMAGDAVIVGSGINTRMAEGDAPVGTATSFRMLGVEVDEDRLLSDYLRALGRGVADLRSEEGLARVHRAVSARCVTLGLSVEVSLPGGASLRGEATRLEQDGRLVVREVDGVEHPVSAGDVVHVRPA